MKSLISKNDNYQMNWIEGNTEWGTVRAPEGIEVSVSSKIENDTVTESYTFTNKTDKDIFTERRDISIYTPFNDDYTGAEICMTNRCHTHIWCGGEVSYIMALRMGGKAPHLGLALTKGSLSGYSIERDLTKISNDRGDFILHPSPVSLAPNESFTIEWILFWHNGIGDFYNKLKKYNPNYIDIKADNFVVFENEDINITIEPSFEFSRDDVSIENGGRTVGFEIYGDTIKIKENCPIGEQVYNIIIKGIKTLCRLLVLPELKTLIEKRCLFLAEKQQYHNSTSGLDGAYLIYDNEEQHIFYSGQNDYNGGRERVGMGVLLARYLQTRKNEIIEKSLDKYIEYIERELFNTDTGEVYNDYNRDNSYPRLYNYPWIAVFYIELYKLKGGKQPLTYAYRALCSYYEQGGADFYAIELPLRDLIHCLDNEDMPAKKQTLMGYFEKHCDTLIKNGLNYPTSEVNYEQSIVAPAADILLQMYEVTGDKKHLDAAEKQIKVLELFNGLQPDYHLYETAIRHWDGYWFGKKRMYGDTFPHYWSALTGRVYLRYASLTGKEEYTKKAIFSLRGVLSLLFPDGSASCAYVYPASVNGETAGYYDVYANDQDWGLYYMCENVAHIVGI